MFGKTLLSMDYLKHCVATHQGLFNNKQVIEKLVKKNKTMLDSIEEDCTFFLSLHNKSELQKHELEIKDKFQGYLDEYEEVLQSYEDVFFKGYFTIGKEDSDEQILEGVKGLLQNRTENMKAMDFNVRKVLIEHKMLQDSIVMMMRVATEYLKELSEDFKETKDTLTQKARHKALCNYEVCKVKICGDWMVKAVVELAGIFALLKPSKKSFNIYVLVVLIGRYLDYFWKDSIYAYFLKDTELPAELFKAKITDDYYSIAKEKIPNPPILYCPWTVHFATIGILYFLGL